MFRVSICSADRQVLFDRQFENKDEAIRCFEGAKIQQSLHQISTVATFFEDYSAIFANQHFPKNRADVSRLSEQKVESVNSEDDASLIPLTELMQRLMNTGAEASDQFSEE